LKYCWKYQKGRKQRAKNCGDTGGVAGNVERGGGR